MDGNDKQLSAEPLVMLTRLASDHDAPGAARAMTRGLLDGLDHNGGHKHDDLMLSVSELVSNAVVHGPRGGLSVALTLTGTLVRVEVSDPGRTPFPTPDGFGPNGHWGLSLVRQVSDRSGIDRRPWTVAWCEIDLAG
jgi:anti-sigma regulatory factor (Ser/Thr protein kinase)